MNSNQIENKEQERMESKSIRFDFEKGKDLLKFLNSIFFKSRPCHFYNGVSADYKILQYKLQIF